MSQKDLIIEFFTANPNRNIPHPEVVDWVVNELKVRTGEVFRDPDRAIRNLAQEGFLIKMGKGVYKYDPNFVVNRKLENFTTAQKKIIFERDGYKCVICGRGAKEGMELHADHIKAKDFGGEATIENGQTLCSQHNFMKKNFKQTETGKKMFIRLYELAKSHDDLPIQQFCIEILDVFDKHKINGHIEWKK
jgi:HNH endonuclease